MPDIPKLVKYGNAAFEGFSPPQLMKARRAWDNAKRSAGKALASVKNFDQPNEILRITRWFGLTPKRDPRHAQLLMAVQGKIADINNAFMTKPITLVYRPAIQVKHIPANHYAPLVNAVLDDGTLFNGRNVYGYVHQHLAGSGYRVVLGRYFLIDRSPNEDAQTIYHELTHKVANTVDHKYGVEECEKLARSDPMKACQNADSFGYFAKSLM